jgi:hypothetical protein
VTPEPLFTKGALKLITAQAKGTPRALNILCTNALIAGFGYRQKPITARTVKEVIGEGTRTKKLSRLRTGFAWAAALAMCVGGFWASPYKESVVARIEQNKPAAMVKVFAGTDNHPVAVPVQPQREPLPLRHGVLEALYPPQPGPLPQSMAPAAKSDTLQRTEVIVKKPTEDSTTERPELPQTAADNTPQEQSQKSPEPWEEGKKAALPLLRVMQKGEYISKIALEVYGYANDEILSLIKKHNPQIKDINRVEVGEKVLFPEFRTAAR